MKKNGDLGVEKKTDGARVPIWKRYNFMLLLSFGVILMAFTLGGGGMGCFFLALVAGHLGYRIDVWLDKRHQGQRGETRSRRERIAEFLEFDLLKVLAKDDQRTAGQVVFRHTLGVAVFMMVILHLYVIPILIGDWLEVAAVARWIDVTEPVFGALGGLTPAVQNFTSDLIEHGYAHRIPIVRHVYGVALLTVVVFGLWSLPRLPKTVSAYHSWVFSNRRRYMKDRPLFRTRFHELVSRIGVLVVCMAFIAFGLYATFLRVDGIHFTFYPTDPFPGQVHDHNQSLLVPAWFAPLTTHGFILLTLVYAIDTVRSMVDRNYYPNDEE